MEDQLEIGDIVEVLDLLGDPYYNLGQIINGPRYGDPLDPVPMWKVDLRGRKKAIWVEDDTLEFMFPEPPPPPPIKYNRFTFLDLS